MKKLYKTFLAACILCFVGLLTSCNDWLEVEPDTETDKNSLLSNEAGFADALSGIYVNMISENLYGKNMTWYMLELMGGGAVSMYGNNTSLQMFYFHPKYDYYSESFRNTYVDPIWNEEYNTIANVNSLLESIDGQQSVFQGEDYNVFKGELLGLRAFLHFDVMRLYADAYTSADYSETNTYIPYVTAITSNVHPLLTNNQVCELLLTDLEEAKELLKSDPMYTGSEPSEYVCSTVTGSSTYRNRYGIEDWHNRRFHFNYYAAVATMARIYLWMGNKTKAKECALEVIAAQETKFPWVNTTLVSNTQSSSQYVARDRTFCTEQIFALNIQDLEDKTDGYLWQGETAFNSAYGNILGFNASVFDAATRQYDIRYAYLKDTYSYYGTEFVLSSKYVQDEDYDNYYSPWARNRLALIRLAEMYYIAAECEDDLETAVSYLNTVRSHRGLSAYPLSVSSREELQEQIRLEYHKEMIAEGQTFYYYKRLNESITNMSAWSSYVISPNLFTMPRPDDEDTYGGRTTE